MSEDLILLLETCVYLLCTIAFGKNPLAAEYIYILYNNVPVFLFKWNYSGLTDPWNRSQFVYAGCNVQVFGVTSPPRSQVRRTACGRAACPMSVERCCSRPSTTCWNAVSWTVASSASASGSSSHTKRRRRPLIKGKSCFPTADHSIAQCKLSNESPMLS